MKDTKRFHIGDILTVITDRLVSPDHIGGLYNILDWMTDESLMTHQLPRVSEEVAPFLREQFPDLAQVNVPEGIDSMEKVLAWLNSIPGPKFREVPKAPDGAHARIDPLLELQHRVGADRVFPVVLNP